MFDLFGYLFGLQEALAQRGMEVDHPGALSDLNTPIGNSDSWLTDRGSLVTVFKIEGARKFPTLESHRDNVEDLVESLRQFIQTGTTDLCWFHSHNDEMESNKQAIMDALQAVQSVSRMQGYDNDIFIREQVDVMAPVIQNESTYLCVWTRRNEGAGVRDKSVPIIKAHARQDTFWLNRVDALLPSHKAKIDTIEEALKEANLKVRRLTNSDVGEYIGRSLDPSANETFTPRLLGHIKEDEDDEQAKEEKKQGKKDRSTTFFLSSPSNLRKGIKGRDYTVAFPPKVGYQVWRTHPEYENNCVIVGSRRYASILVTMVPDHEVAFEKLVTDLKHFSIPFRFSMMNQGQGITSLSAKHSLGMLLRRLPGTNNLLYMAGRQMKAFHKANNPTLSMQVLLTIWGPKHDKELLDQRIQNALKAVGGWGGAQGQLMRDDSIFGLLSTLPPYRSSSVAPAAFGPAEEVLGRAPITRAALPWTEGGLLTRSQNGKLLPIQPLSDLLSHHVYLVCGEPGFGKSLICALIIIAIAETHDVLPYLAMTDVGASSLGTIRYLQSILPAQRKHQVLFVEMRNAKSMSINRYDTPLGVRLPLADDMQAMIDWTLLGMSDSQTGEIERGVDKLVFDVIRLAFERCADEGPRAEPKRHDEANESDKYWTSVIQPALDRHSLVISRDTVYWRLVDALFEAGESHAAALVQRFAVPLLSDIVSAVNATEIRSAHGRELAPNYTLADYAYQALSSLQSELLVTQLPTQFDLTDVRVTAFNLEGVVQNSETPSAKRQGGLFLGLTSELQVAQFFWDTNRVNETPKKYREYHRRRLDNVKRTKNLYFADEQQYFTGIAVADRIPDTIATLGRKRGIGVMLATQLPKYFTKIMRELSKMRIYVGFDKTSLKSVVEEMDLEPFEADLLEGIKKPNRKGSHALIQVDAEDGRYSQLVNIKVGIRKLWGLSTKDISTTVREEIIKDFGYQQGIELLAHLFPSGEAESEYERLRTQITQSQSHDTGLAELNPSVPVTSILDHLIEGTREKGRNILREVSLDVS